MSDAIVNTHDINTAFYREKEIGPRFRVFRESDYNFILDECEVVCSEKGSLFQGKEYKGGKTVLAKTFLDKTHNDLKEGVILSWSQGEKLLAMLELVGVRALRDYKYLSLLLELLREHYADGRGELETNEL